MKIIEDPTEEIIDKDLGKASFVAVIHSKRKIEFKELINITKVPPNYQVVYIHHYSKDNKYTIGVKEGLEEVHKA